MAGTTLGNVLEFFRRFGIFDVLLPFLLVFSVVFALLEKSRILGEIHIGDEVHPQKNLDAMVAFVIALLVVAATQIVVVINEALPKVALLIVVALSFLLLVGMFVSGGEVFEGLKEAKIKIPLIIASFLIVILIFLGTLQMKDGRSWLKYGFEYTLGNWSGATVGSIVLFLIFIGVIIYIIGPSRYGAKEENKGKNGK